MPGPGRKVARTTRNRLIELELMSRNPRSLQKIADDAECSKVWVWKIRMRLIEQGVIARDRPGLRQPIPSEKLNAFRNDGKIPDTLIAGLLGDPEIMERQ